MHTLVRLDDWLIARIFQPICSSFHNWTDKNNFWLAKMCFWADSIATLVIALVFYYTKAAPDPVIGFFVFNAFLAVFEVMRCERDERRRDEGDTVNLYRHDFMEILVRLLFGGLGILCLLVALYFICRGLGSARSLWAYVFFYTSFPCGLYFKACTSYPQYSEKLAPELS